MKILAESNPGPSEGFLHIGYISAYPRTYFPHYSKSTTIEEVINLDQALLIPSVGSLSGKLPEPASGKFQQPRQFNPSQWHGKQSEPQLFALATVFFLALGWFAHIRRRAASERHPGGGGRVVPLLLVLILTLLMYPYLLLSTEEMGAGNLFPHPRRHAPIVYQNPEAATKALIKGILMDVIAQSREPVETFSDMRGEMCLPLPMDSHSPGLAHAIQNYGVDGWGRNLKMESKSDGLLLLSSSGKDGLWETADDLSTPVWSVKGEWEKHIRGLYLRKDPSGHSSLFLRRSPRLNFEFRNAVGAQTMTGSDFFDLLATDEGIGEFVTISIDKPGLYYLAFAPFRNGAY